MAWTAASTADALARARAGGQRAVLITVAGPADTAAPVGRALVVTEDGQQRGGGLGADALDAAGAVLASEAFHDATVQRRVVPHPAAPDTGVELVAEVHEPEPAVMVLGATEAGLALVRLVRALPRRATLLAPGGTVDVPGGTEVRADQPPRVLLAAPPGPADAVVCADPHASWAVEALRVALASDAGYVGVVADEAGARLLRRRLADAEVPPERLQRLHCPAGRALDAADPGEAALAALAEAVAARRHASGRGGGER